MKFITLFFSKINGWKTKGGGGVMILSGAGDFLQSVAVFLKGLLQITDLNTALQFFKNMPDIGGLVLIGSGMAIIGIGHKFEKAEVKKYLKE